MTLSKLQKMKVGELSGLAHNEDVTYQGDRIAVILPYWQFLLILDILQVGDTVDQIKKLKAQLDLRYSTQTLPVT